MEFMRALFSFEGAGEDAVAPILDKIKASFDFERSRGAPLVLQQNKIGRFCFGRRKEGTERKLSP